ncbi:MAG TPA: hypothetical protein VFT09_03015, partial [Ilumatobacteraceae bacterium]|nr:hypothetical protein [Ilumatobacteraceae bacterium]
MARLGADVDRLDALAATCSSTAGRLDRAAGALTTATARAGWHGPDAEQFRAAWTGRHAPRLRAVAGVLADLAAAVREQAAQQRATSTTGAPPAPDGGATPSVGDGDEDDDGWPDWLEDSWLGAFVPPGPTYLHSGPDSPWTQQGQGYDAGRDEILTTYYDQDDTVDGAPDIPGVLLSIQDRATGSETTAVHLVGTDGMGGPLHGGGVSTDGDLVYVVGDGTVWVYERAAIDAAPAGGAVTPLHEIRGVPASSFSTLHDGRLYVGEYRDGDPGSPYSYALVPGSTLSDERDEGPTP